MKAFKIQNRYLLGLASWLNMLPLAGRESRERSRFVTLVSDTLARVEKERVQIIEKYANKEEDGSMKKTVDNGVERFDIPDDKIADLEKDYGELLDEEFVLDVGESHKAKIRTVRDIVLNTDYKFGPSESDDVQEKQAKIRQAFDYEKWCESFEGLDFED